MMLCTSDSGERHRLVVDVDEAGHARRVAQRVPGVVVHLHPHQHVAGEDLRLHRVALAVPDLDLVLGRHHDLVDPVAQIERLDAGLDRLLDLVLVAGVGVQDVPLTFGRLDRLSSLGGALRGQALAQ